MAVNLKATLKREVDQLKRQIARADSQLVSLRKELMKRQKIHQMLGDEHAVRRTVRKPSRGQRGRRTNVDWSQVLKAIPTTFTIDHVARQGAARGKPRAYLRQILVRWGKEGKIKRTARGRYQKKA